MNKVKLKSIIFAVIFAALLLPLAALADPGNQYCVTPPFITAGIQPNLLLMMDNSASMFDLAYADKGSTSPLRKSTYCYDNTYSDGVGSTPYAGYFDNASYYDFNIDSGVFTKIVSFPGAGDCTYRIDGKYCIKLDDAVPKRVTKFSASGNYLNWMTASKFDIQKKILTGGKYAGGNLVAESRGCVGRGFTKQPLSSNSGNFVAFADGAADPNTPIPVTLQVRGENPSFDEAAASQGGQTYINFYYGSGGTIFSQGICKTAITHLTDGGSLSGPDKDDILACIGASGGDTDLSGKKKQIFNQSLQECWQYDRADPHTVGHDAYANGTTFCTSSYNLREKDHGPLAFSPARDIQVGDADLLCSFDYVGACYNGTKTVASLPQPPASLFDFLLPKSAYAAADAGNIQFGAATYSVAENAAGGTISIPVTRTGGKKDPTTVNYATSDGTATAGSDYTATSGTLSWANADDNTKYIVISITNDGTGELAETFKVTLSGVTNSALGGVTQTVVTISDDDGAPLAGSIAFSAAAYSVTEGGGTVTITVNRTGGTLPGVGVSYATSNGSGSAGTHYTATSGTLTWGLNEVAKTFIVPIIDAGSGNKTFNLTLSAATGGASLGAQATAVVTIIDDGGFGSIALTSSTYSVAETTATVTISVKRSSAASPPFSASINYAASNGTALAGTNYTATSGTLTWSAADGEATKTFTVPIINAGSAADKTFTITLSGIVNATLGTPASATVTITFVGAPPAAGTWPDSWTGCADGLCGEPCFIAQHNKYCGGVFSNPPVTDPTDDPSADTTLYGNLPAVLADMAVGGQLGAPLKIISSSGLILNAIPVKLPVAEPSGLIQEFGSKIRVGLMSFNYVGSPSECGPTTPVPCPRYCSNVLPPLPPKPCGSFLDCCQNSIECRCDPAVANANNADGARLLYPVGLGTCSHDDSTPCTTKEHCTSLLHPASVCNVTVSASHSSELISQIDSLRATSWTPFAEAFYDAIGYFAYMGPTLSRTDVRLNPVDAANAAHPIDFPADRNPSQFICQQNNILLISDGASTADQQATVMDVADVYKTAAGLTGGACSAYLGSSNLPILSWLAQNKNISTFSTSDAAASVDAARSREKITTFTVFNGQNSGVPGECNSSTLLSNTATKGGGEFFAAPDPVALETSLRSVFEKIAARAASGTAASILSNSEGSGANILQAVFYPRKIFNVGEAEWIGEMQNLWYYVDPLINNSTIREDTNLDSQLHLQNDYVARFTFDTTEDRTMVQLLQDTNGDGTGDTLFGGLIDPDNVKSLWRAGKLLWARNIASAPRRLLTNVSRNYDAPTVLQKPALINFASATYPGGAVASTAATLAPFLQLGADDVAAGNLINWVHGLDAAPFRNRTVQIRNAASVLESGTWRLGDIISSTPRVQSTVRQNTYDLSYPGGYGDKSYESYILSKDYADRGMVYVGGNDGMFHAFNLGILDVKASGLTKAKLTGSDKGKEMWAFIPKNTLPYLKYLADDGYGHIYSIDGRTSIFDASIGYTGDGTCIWATYHTCDKLRTSKVVDSSNNLDPAKNTWRTVVIGGMGIGGASAASCVAGTNCVPTPLTDPSNTDTNPGLGYSSYFALDVTLPTSPVLLWEFNNPGLGYATSGPAIVRIGPKDKNGKWFAVFGSGPTGPINPATNQFLGRSDQRLKFFVIDLQTGKKMREIDTLIENAFAGPLLGGSIDADRGAPALGGNYQDDAIYVGYTKKDTSVDTSVTPNAWLQGGVGRIITKESADPDDWEWSVVLDDIGPVTTVISRLQDSRITSRKLWLFFGTGRYFFRDPLALDDNANQRSLFGIKEPCYNTDTVPGNVIDPNCTAAVSGDIVDQTTATLGVFASVGDSDGGWKIDLDAATASEGAERVVTDTVALTNGTVFFTTFKPTLDLCGYGGNSFLWGVKYDTGGQAAANALTGKVLIQLSTGEFKEVDLATAFTTKDGRRMATPMTGKPPSDAPPIISNSSNKPVKKILHIRER